jgi:hypothetical protein
VVGGREGRGGEVKREGPRRESSQINHQGRTIEPSENRYISNDERLRGIERIEKRQK